MQPGAQGTLDPLERVNRNASSKMKKRNSNARPTLKTHGTFHLEDKADRRSQEQVFRDKEETRLRMKKQIEERLKAAEVLNRQQRMKEFQEKPGSVEVQKMVKNMRGIKEDENLFVQMRERG